jgi:hypothetical protein
MKDSIEVQGGVAGVVIAADPELPAISLRQTAEALASRSARASAIPKVKEPAATGDSRPAGLERIKLPETA